MGISRGERDLTFALVGLFTIGLNTLTSEVTVLAGGPALELIERTGDLDLLVCGSRGYGPTRAVLGRMGLPGFSVYSACKFGLRGWTEALNIEWADHDIKVLSVWPIFVKTAMVGRPDASVSEARDRCRAHRSWHRRRMRSPSPR